MILHWLLNILCATHCFWVEIISSQHLELCNSTGEHPAPELFHSAGSLHIGDSISLLCMDHTNSNITRFFFCKDKTLVSAQKSISNMATYTFNITQSSTGQYSCGYQHKGGLNQQTKSVLSLFWNLTVPPGKDNFHSYAPERDEIDGTTNFIDKKIWITLVLVFVILILAALTYHLVKKATLCQLKEKSNPQNTPYDNGEVSDIRNNRKHLSEQVQ
ncbi:uncharacterized protein LOC112542690, partial [Python bivittatus]|uniref:Uncharacterized protein LOC112542690 n=1 Tax=Python bivittatus TaxID=176946 RepID=A0A9F5J849_PYTBI